MRIAPLCNNIANSYGLYGKNVSKPLSFGEIDSKEPVLTATFKRMETEDTFLQERKSIEIDEFKKSVDEIYKESLSNAKPIKKNLDSALKWGKKFNYKGYKVICEIGDDKVASLVFRKPDKETKIPCNIAYVDPESLSVVAEYDSTSKEGEAPYTSFIYRDVDEDVESTQSVENGKLISTSYREKDTNTEALILYEPSGYTYVERKLSDNGATTTVLKVSNAMGAKSAEYTEYNGKTEKKYVYDKQNNVWKAKGMKYEN